MIIRLLTICLVSNDLDNEDIDTISDEAESHERDANELHGSWLRDSLVELSHVKFILGSITKMV